MEQINFYFKLFLSKWIKPLLLSFCVFILPIKALMISIGLFVVADTITGVIRSNKVGIKFSSRRFMAFFNKSAVYQLALICTFYLDKSLLNEITNLFIQIPLLVTKLMSLTIVFNEVKSINENLKIAYKIDLFEYGKSLFRASKEIKDVYNELNDNQS